MGPIVIDVDPAILRVGHFALRWYGLFIGVAIAAAFALAWREGARRGISEDRIMGAGMWGVAGGFVGARLLHVVDRWPEYAANPAAILALQNGGLAIYGGILGGAVAASIYARRSKLPLAKLADTAAPGLILAQAIGRVGCIINGDAVGGPTDLPWGFVYLNPEAMAPQLGVAFHPNPVYEMVGDLLILAFLWWLRPRASQDGVIFLSYLVLYSALKFTVSFTRTEVIFFAGLQEAQVVSLIGGLAAVAALIYLGRKPQGLPETALAASLGGRGTGKGTVKAARRQHP